MPRVDSMPPYYLFAPHPLLSRLSPTSFQVVPHIDFLSVLSSPKWGGRGWGRAGGRCEGRVRTPVCHLLVLSPSLPPLVRSVW